MNNEEKILEMLTALTGKVDAMDGRLDRLETGQVRQGEQIAAIQATLAEHGAILAEHGAALERLEKRVERLDERVETLDERVERLDERVERLDERVERLDEQVKTLDERSLKSAVLLETDVARDIHLLYEGHSEMKRKLDTLATKEQVEELSGDVEVIKSVVSRHSGDISKLKRAQ